VGYVRQRSRSTELPKKRRGAFSVAHRLPGCRQGPMHEPCQPLPNEQTPTIAEPDRISISHHIEAKSRPKRPSATHVSSILVVPQNLFHFWEIFFRSGYTLPNILGIPYPNFAILCVFPSFFKSLPIWLPGSWSTGPAAGTSRRPGGLGRANRVSLTHEDFRDPRVNSA
jgi:hypothetical protein